MQSATEHHGCDNRPDEATGLHNQRSALTKSESGRAVPAARLPCTRISDPGHPAPLRTVDANNRNCSGVVPCGTRSGGAPPLRLSYQNGIYSMPGRCLLPSPSANSSFQEEWVLMIYQENDTACSRQQSLRRLLHALAEKPSTSVRCMPVISPNSEAAPDPPTPGPGAVRILPAAAPPRPSDRSPARTPSKNTTTCTSPPSPSIQRSVSVSGASLTSRAPRNASQVVECQ